MKLTCNIDSRGMRARLMAGCALGAISMILAVAAWFTGVAWLWWPMGGFACGSCVMVFEARSGWCMVRAMGFKTRI